MEGKGVYIECSISVNVYVVKYDKFIIMVFLVLFIYFRFYYKYRYIFFIELKLVVL